MTDRRTLPDALLGLWGAAGHGRIDRRDIPGVRRAGYRLRGCWEHRAEIDQDASAPRTREEPLRAQDDVPHGHVVGQRVENDVRFIGQARGAGASDAQASRSGRALSGVRLYTATR